MKHLIYILFPVLLASLSVKAQSRIDRKAVVERHKIVTTKTNPQSPAQVGNGEFAFGVDITGLQTFVPFNTMAQWSWHSFPLPEGMSDKDYRQVPINTYCLTPPNRSFPPGWQQIRIVSIWDVSV